jgi:hypothetical protein
VAMSTKRLREIRLKGKKNRNTKALDAWKEKFPLPKKSAFQVDQFMKDEEGFDALLDSIADGNSVRHFCKELSMPVSAIVKMNRSLAALKAPDARYEAYQTAKQARAHHHADVMLDIIEKVTDGEMTSQQGTMCIRGLQWLAERMDPINFSGRIQIDANIKMDTASSHLEAVRQMAELVKADLPGTVIEGDVVEVVTPEDEDPFGLLE